MTGEGLSFRGGPFDDFVQQILEFIHNPTETLATPANLAGIYRRGFAYGQDVQS